jgi:hypothetical protein
MRRGCKICLLCGICLLFLIHFSPQDRKDLSSKASTITASELRDHIFFLASDELEGRMVASRGFLVAALYASSQFREAGLKQIVEDENGKPSFLQPVHLIHKVYHEDDVITIRTEEKEYSFSLGDMCLIATIQWPEDKLPPVAAPVYVGYGIHEPDVGWDDYSGIDLHGRVVLCLSGRPNVHGKSILPEEAAKKYSDFEKALARKLREIVKRGAEGVLFILDRGTAERWQELKRMRQFRCDAYHYPGLPEPAPPGNQIPILVVHPDAAEKIFETQDYDPFLFESTGEEEDYRRFVFEGAVLALQTKYKRTDIICHNVVGMVAGTDADVSGQVITVGAHLDHIGFKEGLVCNGADDNASGCAAVMEAADAVAMTAARSVVFVLYTGEEQGLLGSRYFVDHCPVPLDNVVVNINLDMVGRKGTLMKVDGEIKAFGPEQAYPELKGYLARANEHSSRMLVDYGHDEKDAKRYIQTSDQFTYHKMGIPIVYFADGGTEDLHKPTDDAEKIDFEKTKRVSQLVYELAMELGNAESPLHKPEADNIK